MRERKKALERLVAVKTQLHRLEEVRLAEIETLRGQARRDRDAMIGLLDQTEAADRLILSLACKKVVAVERGAARLDAAAAEQRQVLLRHGAQKRSAEKLLKETATAIARDEEKRALFDIAEKIAGASATSLP
jgi:hypothetical protein